MYDMKMKLLAILLAGLILYRLYVIYRNIKEKQK